MRRLHSLLLAVVLATVAVLTSGCEISGTLDLSHADVADVDLTLRATDWDCSSSGWEGLGLTVSQGGFENGVVECTMQGQVPVDKLFDYLPGSSFAPTSLGYLLVLDLLAYGTAQPDLDLTVTMPGPIWHASAGEINGNQVHLAGAKELGQVRLIVESADPAKIWIPLAGLAAVLALVGAAFWLGRRSRKIGPVTAPADAGFSTEPSETPISTDLSESHAPIGTPVPDNSVWMPPKDGS